MPRFDMSDLVDYRPALKKPSNEMKAVQRLNVLSLKDIGSITWNAYFNIIIFKYLESIANRGFRFSK